MSIIEGTSIFSIRRESDFQRYALELFRYQARNNAVYSQFLSLIKADSEHISSLEDIPFLPIEFFKSHPVKTGAWEEESIFTSSGTSGSVPSRHFVKSLSFYLENCLRIFELYYGPIQDYHLLALLPSYLEREGSSLVRMVDYFIQETGSDLSGFFLHDHQALLDRVAQARQKGGPRKVLIIGVSFALLDLAESKPDLQDCIIMETGGMKGRREELIRADLHKRLMAAFGVPEIHSEYGMTELLSQAYAHKRGHFQCPPWMKLMIRQVNDPLAPAEEGKGGLINVIDLANQATCAFIQTQDLGRQLDQNSYEVLGRMDHSETRGCNLMVQ